MAGEHIVDASELYSEDPRVVMAGLRDGATHAPCTSCQRVMRTAVILIERLLKERESERGGRR